MVILIKNKVFIAMNGPDINNWLQLFTLYFNLGVKLENMKFKKPYLEKKKKRKYEV